MEHREATPIPSLSTLLSNEALRGREFPASGGGRVFLAHAGVAPIPARAAEAIGEYARRAAEGAQEGDWVWPRVAAARKAAARLLGCGMDEIALLGPTALGLSLVAHGLPWAPGDEVVYYEDDYPANVYPWSGLRELGVRPVPLRTAALDRLGALTWEALAPLLTERTRLVSLASCHFLSGYRPDLPAIGKRLREKGILFCVDGIQTLGAFPTPVEHVDFLSADSHKWLLGPVGAGIVFVRKERQSLLRPILRGAWNIESPGFIAQSEIRYEPGARRYEPGSLNLPGILGMLASMELLDALGTETVADRLLAARAFLLEGLFEMGFVLCGGGAGEDLPGPACSGIITVSHPRVASRDLMAKLSAEGVVVSMRGDRAGQDYIRFSPHAYNTDADLARALEVLRRAMG